MPSFDARLRLPGQTRLPLSVLVDISDEQIVITSGQERLGEWALEGVKVDSRPDGFHLVVDHEEMVLTVTDAARFARELGVAQEVEKGSSPTVGARNGRKGISGRLDAVDPEERFEDLSRRVSELATELTDESVPPEDFFGRWLRLLKEINLRHGQGAMPSTIFYRLNTQLLDLMPAPASTPPPQVAESRKRATET